MHMLTSFNRKIFSDIPNIKYVLDDEEARKKIKVIRSTSKRMMLKNDVERLSFEQFREFNHEWDFIR